MYCLNCGDCCLRMSPKSFGPCPDIIKKGTFYFCGDQEQKPQQCAKHDFFSRWCPIGFEKLRLKNPQEVARRVDMGYEMIVGGLK